MCRNIQEKDIQNLRQNIFVARKITKQCPGEFFFSFGFNVNNKPTAVSRHLKFGAVAELKHLYKLLLQY